MSNVKANQIIFELITHKTIQNQFYHAFFIFVDYYPILINSLTSITKISKYSHPLSEAEEVFKLLKHIFPYRYLSNGLNNYISLSLLIAIGFFLLLYYLLIYLLKYSLIRQKNSGAFIQKNNILNYATKIFVNFYDFLFMRYLSSYISLILCNYIIYYLYKDDTKQSSILALVFICVFGFYLLTAYSHLNTYFVIIQISNEAISKDKGKYPYDIIFSLPFDNLLFVIKILVSIEYNYTNCKQKIDLFSSVLNIMIVFLVLLISLLFSFQVTSYKKLDNYIFNKTLNLSRMFINIFNIYFVIIVSCFCDKNTHWSILSILFIICIFWAFFTILLIWLVLIKPRFFDGSITLQKILYIMVQSKKERSIVLTTGESFFNVNLIKIQDAIEFHHRINCVDFEKCYLCKKYTNKEPVTVFDLYKHIIKKESDNVIHNEIDILYRDLIKLFYYHIKKKIFKFYSWYRKIYIKFDKVDKTIVNNLSYIISLCLSYYDSYNVVTFHEIFQFTNLNEMVEKHLENIKNFIASANELKYVDKFFNLSRDIRKLRDYQLYVLQHIEIKDDYSTISDTFTRNVKNVYKYNLLLNRFIVETITNHHYKELSELNLDLFEEYMNYHFDSDKLLMFNLDMDHENQHNDVGVHNNSYTILKCGKELITYRDKTFVDMMPKKLKKYGLSFFVNKLSKYIDYDTLENEVVDSEETLAHRGTTQGMKSTKGKINTNLYSKTQNNGNGSDNSSLYQFVINSSVNTQEIALLSYSFKVSRSLVNENMLIYGYYTGLKSKIMLFQMNKLNDVNNVKDSLNMKLENFSTAIKNILMLEANWIEILDKSNNSVYFNTLFKSFKLIQDDKALIYECVLDYEHFINSMKHFAKILKEFLDNELNTKNENNNRLTRPGEKNLIEEKIEKLSEKKGKTLIMRLKLLFEINVNIVTSYKVFSVSLQTKSKKKSIVEGIEIPNEDEWRENASDSSQTNSLLKNNMTNKGSTTSMTESLSIKLTQSSKGSKMKFSNAINNQNSKVDKISSTFNTFSYLILILNFLIITVCIIFMIVQILLINKLKRINTLNYEFKRIRIAFAHSFLSVFTNGCLAEYKSKKCLSAYNTYSEELIEKNDYPEEYNVRNYLLAEIKYKINDMQTTFYSYKEDVFSFGDKELQTTLTNQMVFTSFEQKDDQLVQQLANVTLEEGIRKYINSFTVLLQNDFTNVPIYIISYRDSIVDFSNMETQNLSDVQTQIYLILINYINYSTLFMNSEDNLEKKYDDIVTLNETVLLMFMVFVAVLNLGLLLLCIWNIFIVTKLFLNFIMGMIMILGDNDFKLFYIERIDNLIELSHLYRANPNHLIHNIKKNEQKIASQIRAKNKKQKNVTSKGFNQTEKDLLVSQEKEKEVKPKGFSVDISKIKVVLLPFILKLSGLFSVYFIVLIAFDAFLLIKFQNVLTINDYILNNFLMETQMYDVLVLTQIMTLLNLTQNDFANSLGIDNPDSDGVINMKIRETASYIKIIQNDEVNSNSAFETISEFFNNKQCNNIFRNIENNLTAMTVEETGIDYYELQGLLCESFGIMSLPSFEYMFNDYILRVQKLQNLISSYSYEDLYYFNTQYEFFDLITMILLNMQPIRNYIRTVLLDNLMNKTIKDFIILITVYLGLNIAMDIAMYIIIKLNIAGKLDKMHRDLLMFNNCFSY